MDKQFDDQDCLYDDLPEMSDSPLLEMNATSSLSQEDHAPSTSNLTNISSPSSTDFASIRTENPFLSKQYGTNTSKKCPCRENVQWTWDNNKKSRYVELLNDDMDVKFHRSFSNGTAMVRCTEPMSKNQYYWEVEMTYPVYGTDIMIGIGTPEAEIKHLDNKFISPLGKDNKSWGLSYTGLFHHSGLRQCYAPSFGQGSVIGVHVDLWRGALSFYKDRKHLGVASTGLKGKTLYAMASSTAARSGMRIIRSCSFPSSLQFLCCVKLRELIPDDRNVLDEIDIPLNLKKFLRNRLSWLLDKRYLEKEVHICCSAEDKSADGEITDSSTEIIDPFAISGPFILLGSVLLSDHNRHRRTLQSQRSEGAEVPEVETKRARCS